MEDLKIREDGSAVVFTAKIVPGSSRTAIAGLLDGMLKVRVAAPAEKGKANRCLQQLLARELGVRTRDVGIISGLSSPVKQVRITGLSARKLVQKLQGERGDQ